MDHDSQKSLLKSLICFIHLSCQVLKSVQTTMNSEIGKSEIKLMLCINQDKVNSFISGWVLYINLSFLK